MGNVLETCGLHTKSILFDVIGILKMCAIFVHYVMSYVG